jgi:parallel beta-helix repeat protein
MGDDAEWNGNLGQHRTKAFPQSIERPSDCQQAGEGPAMVKRRDVDDLRPHSSGLTPRCLFIAALMVGLLFVINQAFSKPKTINGACGSANDVAATTAPTTNLCSAGTPSAATGTGPWSWTCNGSGPRPSDASCSAPLQTGGGGGEGDGGSGTSGQKPGPSADLFNTPYYKCVNNFYVATTGSDTNNGSQAAPWLTLKHADSANVGAGSCINVAPGTYDGVTVTNGGNAATPTGYVVYRCETLGGCTVRGNAGVNSTAAFETEANKPPNYLQVDGFVLVGTAPVSGQPFGVGFNVNGGAGNSSHHVWLLNSIVHGFSQSGIGTGSMDYGYFIHNTLFDNAASTSSTCEAQGSGISIFESHSLTSYTPTADDQTNPNPLLGPTWQIGSGFFHFVVEYNVIYNNALLNCGTVSNPIDTDGNGIIFDTNLADGGNTENYPHQSLVAFNVVYNNGGSGIHIFDSAHVTVANNSCYNNQFDPANNGTFKACLDEGRVR